jgi:Tol biopolymer transport system component
MTDFPPSANALEPYITSIRQSELFSEIGSTAGLSVDLLDRQQQWGGQPSCALLEAPDLWRGLIEPTAWGFVVDPPPLEWQMTAMFEITNEYGASAGSYKALFVAKDPETDFWLGDVNHAYQLFTIEVIESVEPEVEGEIVFVGPEIEPEFPPPALNTLLLNLDTMEESQLTSFSGMGAIFEEPRINPLGTHMMLTFCPTPTASHVTMYEIGGSNWDVSPMGVYDGNADFHPDGEHILVASGTQYGDTPDLYSMEYDGSNRELIATAPDTVRNPRWNADGTKIVMTLGQDPHDPPNSALYIYDVDADTFTEIAAAPGVDEHPCWCPVLVDGQEWIAFDSSRDHHPDYNTDIYIINPVTEEIVYRYTAGLYERHPSFSPDGLSFVYCATDGDDEELFVHFWKTGETIQLTDDDSYDGDPSWGWNW